MKLHERIYGVFPSARGGKTDFVVPICMFALFLMGIAFIYSAQSYNIDEIPLARQFWVKQTVFFLFFGLPIYVVLCWTDYKWLFTYSSFIYAGTLLLLIPLALKESFGLPIPFVESRYNATRWIDLGLISIQPSEIAKIGTCIMAASLFARNKITKFKDNDELKVPNVKFSEEKMFDEVTNKRIMGTNLVIDKAMETIKFDMNNKGVELKSEAAMAIATCSLPSPEERIPRLFYFDDTFVIFLKETGKKNPYFALRVHDITKYQ